MTVNQALSHITQTGALPISNSSLICATVLILAVLFFIYKISSGYVNKSCLGCKRLKQCEHDIVEINKALIMEEHIDPNILRDILKQIQQLKEKVMKNG